jgi:hypothetical protein
MIKASRKNQSLKLIVQINQEDQSSKLIKESSQPENQPALSKQISTITSVEGNLIQGFEKTNVDIQHHLHQTQP